MKLANYKKLQKYEELFDRILRNSTMRSQSIGVLDLFYDILADETGEVLHRNYSCSTCQLKITRKIADLYRAHKNNTESKTNEKG